MATARTALSTSLLHEAARQEEEHSSHNLPTQQTSSPSTPRFPRLYTTSYIQQRGEAIEAIERTIADLGGIFGQLATMVSEQAEQIQRIDANTDDVVDNVEGAQRELMKYWGRVQGNRWLVAKMFGVLMICEYFISFSFVAVLANELFCGYFLLTILPHSLPPLGPHSRLEPSATFASFSSWATSSASPFLYSSPRPL
jgi:hypothetical protein